MPFSETKTKQNLYSTLLVGGDKKRQVREQHRHRQHRREAQDRRCRQKEINAFITYTRRPQFVQMVTFLKSRFNFRVARPKWSDCGTIVPTNSFHSGPPPDSSKVQGKS